jgi:2-polyprenyl-3-methyl-5-hydroxy-6-metoxy-1,4-benzoquinol methylase
MRDIDKQYVITADVDWASDYCIERFAGICNDFSITPTLFATHKSPVIDRLLQLGRIEIGLHPNFLPGSDHGGTVQEVIDNIASMYPQAKTYRAHSYVDSFPIQQTFRKRGIEYDSNICTYMQHGLTSLNLGAGLKRYPVFFDDNVHYINNEEEGMWVFEKFSESFSTPGLKVVNFHPFLVSANVISEADYRSIKHLIKSFSHGDRQKRKAISGIESFFISLLSHIKDNKHITFTIEQLYQSDVAIDSVQENVGRETWHDTGAIERYNSLSATEKKEFLRCSFNKRNPIDIYATSRDFYLRELEIESILRNIPATGKILDLGCGNGYTGISIASKREGLNICGVDFSDTLISGAGEILKMYSTKSYVSFICSDVLDYIKAQPPASQDCVITERLIQNLPDRESQYSLIADISRVLKPGGKFLMCEASLASYNELNRLRVSVGLSELKPTSQANVSTIFLDDAEVEAVAESSGLKLFNKLGYSNYFICSRVLHPAVIAPELPRFDSNFNKIAYRIQCSLPFKSGVGSNTLWVYVK